MHDSTPTLKLITTQLHPSIVVFNNWGGQVMPPLFDKRRPSQFYNSMASSRLLLLLVTTVFRQLSYVIEQTYECEFYHNGFVCQTVMLTLTAVFQPKSKSDSALTKICHPTSPSTAIITITPFIIFLAKTNDVTTVCHRFHRQPQALQLFH